MSYASLPFAFAMTVSLPGGGATPAGDGQPGLPLLPGVAVAALLATVASFARRDGGASP